MFNKQKENTTTTPIQSTLTTPSLESKKSKLGLIIGIVVVLVLLAAGAGAGYYYFYTNADPQQVFSQALENLKKLDSGTINYEVDVSMQSKGEKEIDINSMFPTTSFVQDFDFKTILEFSFKKQEDYIQIGSQIDIEVPTGQEIPLLGEITVSPQINVVTLEKGIFFVKIKGIPPIPFFDSSLINDKWIKVELDELDKEYGLKLESFDEIDTQKKEEINKKIIDLYQQYSFMGLENLGDEKVGDDSSYHYKLIFNKDLFVEFSKGVSELYEEEDLSGNYKIDSEKGLDQLKESLENATITGEVWITKRDRLLRKTILNVLYEDEEATVKIGNKIELTNYNQPVEIIEPAESMSVSEIMGMIMEGSGAQGLSSPTSMNASSAKVVADVKQMQTALELFFNDQEAYALPPVGGNRLGLDARMLDDTGFVKVNSEIVYMGNLPSHPDYPNGNYLYYLCDENNYIIEFDLPGDIGNLKAGKNYATPDGIYSSVEISDGYLEFDKDGLPNYFEDKYKTNGISDSVEISDGCLDPDKDGLPNYFEDKYKTDKTNPDTDSDGFLDGEEVKRGYNPAGDGNL